MRVLVEENKVTALESKANNAGLNGVISPIKVDQTEMNPTICSPTEPYTVSAVLPRELQQLGTA